MPSAARFVLKDSPPEVLEAAAKAEPQGRSYSTEHSQQPGGIKMEELTLGMKLAALAITDDKEDTLKKVSKTMPWHKQALNLITGSSEESRKPLSEILKAHMNLELDHIIDVSGMSKAGHVLDTQGFIAHNDEIIVLSYRCTTSAFDWLTNMTTTSSAWEREDLTQGHSGYFSCWADAACCADPSAVKPRVHTGFYNNFLVTHPYIENYIEPLLLQADQPARTLYVVGHSLGGGIATMAACYFLLEHDWAKLPHKLVVVTAGSPRACAKSMQLRIQNELDRLRPLDKAVMCRVVRDKDIVPSVPPAVFGFRHVSKMVYLTKDGAVLINPSLKSDSFVTPSVMKELLEHRLLDDEAAETTTEAKEKAEASNQEESTQHNNNNDDDDSKPTSDNDNQEEDATLTKYDKRVQLVPRAFRDHMPDFYLQPLLGFVENREKGTSEAANSNNNKEDDSATEVASSACPSEDEEEAVAAAAAAAATTQQVAAAAQSKPKAHKHGFLSQMLRSFHKKQEKEDKIVPPDNNLPVSAASF